MHLMFLQIRWNTTCWPTQPTRQYIHLPVHTKGYAVEKVHYKGKDISRWNRGSMLSQNKFLMSYYYFAKFLQSIVLTQVFGVCVCVCVSVIVFNNFLYSISKTILPASSPHLVRTFLTSIPSFLLILGSFRKTRWLPCLFFYSIFSHWLSIGD